MKNKWNNHITYTHVSIGDLLWQSSEFAHLVELILLLYMNQSKQKNGQKSRENWMKIITQNNKQTIRYDCSIFL